MAAGADVPFDPAGEPGVPQREVGELDRRAGVHQMLLRILVEEFPQPAAQLGQEHRPQVLVLQHHAAQLALVQFPPVTRLLLVRVQVRADCRSGNPR